VDNEQFLRESSLKNGVQRSHLPRRALLKMGMFGLASASMVGVIESMAWLPRRVAHAAPDDLPDIQFNIGDYIAPAQTMHGIEVRFGPVFTLFVTARLLRTPDDRDRRILSDALNIIEESYPFRPEGIFPCIAYGLPYFQRLPQGLVAEHMPHLLADDSRFALEEAMVCKTDVSELNPHIQKKTFQIPTTIEQNDLLITLRSDTMSNVMDVANWLRGGRTLSGERVEAPPFSDLLEITSMRLMFVQVGLPHKIANHAKLPYANTVNPQSSMWMGFVDQHVNGSGPAEITTFQGNDSARLTDTSEGDYFYNGSIQHLSHVIQDLETFYSKDESYTERVQYMFRSTRMPSQGYSDQFHHGGGPAFLDNVYMGASDAESNARGLNTHGGKRRMGHLTALQQSSRAQDGTPMHIRTDGPGFDNLDVPDGSNQPKLHFSIFVPSADFFLTMRNNQAAENLCQKYRVPEDDNGLERFLTATRRQNFLVPPRRHRSFPLQELT
jgi:hypothetical protein